MKRRTFVIILLCVGVVGLLLPWKYTLFENESYRITQSPAGGTFTLHIYEELHEIPWDCILSGVDGRNMDEVVEKLLSGDVSGNELAFITPVPEAEFPGMDKLYVPALPSGYKSSRMIFWSVRGYTCSIQNKELNVSGNIALCVNPKICRYCDSFDFDYQSGSDESSAKCYRLIDGTKVIRDGKRINTKSADSGITVHLDLWCKAENVSDISLMGFGAKRYFSTHPKMLMAYAINAGHWLGIIAVTVGVALLPKENLRRKKKTATAE